MSHTNSPFRVRPALCEDLAAALLGPGGAAAVFGGKAREHGGGHGGGHGGRSWRPRTGPAPPDAALPTPEASRGSLRLLPLGGALFWPLALFCLFSPRVSRFPRSSVRRHQKGGTERPA